MRGWEGRKGGSGELDQSVFEASHTLRLAHPPLPPLFVPGKDRWNLNGSAHSGLGFERWTLGSESSVLGSDRWAGELRGLGFGFWPLDPVPQRRGSNSGSVVLEIQKALLSRWDKGP